MRALAARTAPFPVAANIYRLYVLNKVQQGLQDIDAGRTVSSEELTREIEVW